MTLPIVYDLDTRGMDMSGFYAGQLNEVAGEYEREPNTDWASALVRVIALARLYKAPSAVYDPVLAAMVPHEKDILHAALTDMLDRLVGCEGRGLLVEFKEHAPGGTNHLSADFFGGPGGTRDGNPELREYVTCHFELQVMHDWIADRVLMSEALLPSLVGLLDQVGTAIGQLADLIKPYAQLLPTR